MLVSAAAAVAIAAAFLGWRLWPRTEEVLPGAISVEPPAAPPRAVVIDASGVVERTSSGEAWAVLRAGDVLGAREAIRTHAGAEVDLALDGGTRLVLSEHTEATVRDLGHGSARVALSRGRASVVHAPGSSEVRIEDASGEVGASASAGRWDVVVNGAGLGVVAHEGKVEVESGGAAVTVAAGQQTAAWRGAPPLAPRPIPRQLLLKVAREVARLRELCAIVRGRADPASELRIGGARVPIAPDGTFAFSVPRDGRREVAVLLRHVTGRIERGTVPCAAPDISGFEVQWDAR